MIISADTPHIILSADFSRIITAGNLLLIIAAHTAYTRAAAVYRSHIVTVENFVFVVAAYPAHILSAAHCSGIITARDNSRVDAAHAACIIARRNVRTRYSQISDCACVTAKQTRIRRIGFMIIQAAYRKACAVKNACIRIGIRSYRRPRTAVRAAHTGQINVPCQNRA